VADEKFDCQSGLIDMLALDLLQPLKAFWINYEQCAREWGLSENHVESKMFGRKGARQTYLTTVYDKIDQMFVRLVKSKRIMKRNFDKMRQK
jgi:hypothetical protein